MATDALPLVLAMLGVSGIGAGLLRRRHPPPGDAAPTAAAGAGPGAPPDPARPDAGATARPDGLPELLAISHEACLLCDGRGLIAAANAAARALLGGEPTGEPVQRFLPRGVAPGEPDWGGFAGRLVEIVARRADGALFPAELSVCLGGGAGGRIALVRLADVSGRAGRLAELERRALHDLLTGLPNRCLLDDRLTQELRLARRSGQPLAVLMLDLDRFKQVNDRCGHQVGDRLLQAVAGRLRATMRTCDTLGRLGGDEFLAVLPAPTGRRVACRVAGRLVTALRPPIRLDGASFRVGLSVGIAIWPEHGPEPATLLARADGAMYRAKRERSGFRLFRG